jgi:hypothetical protein
MLLSKQERDIELSTTSYKERKKKNYLIDIDISNIYGKTKSEDSTDG